MLDAERERSDAMICVADFSVSDEAFEYFKAEARKRKVSVAELARVLMDTIAADKMVDAILDDSA
jgi:hypothetical protein